MFLLKPPILPLSLALRFQTFQMLSPMVCALSWNSDLIYNHGVVNFPQPTLVSNTIITSTIPNFVPLSGSQNHVNVNAQTHHQQQQRLQEHIHIFLPPMLTHNRTAQLRNRQRRTRSTGHPRIPIVPAIIATTTPRMFPVVPAHSCLVSMTPSGQCHEL